MSNSNTIPFDHIIQNSAGVKRAVVSVGDDNILRVNAYDANGDLQGTPLQINLANGRLALFGETPVAQQAAITVLTDSSAGTANNTVEAMPNPTDSPATADALRDDLVAVLIPAIRNNFADVAAKINAILAALQNVGIIA